MKYNKPLVYVVLFSLFWAFYILLSRLLLDRGIQPLLMHSSSLLITFVFFSIYYLLFLNKINNTISSREKGYSVLSGILGVGLSGLVGLMGLHLSSVVNYGFLIKTSTLFAIFFSFLFFKEPLGKNKLFYLILLLIGTYLLTISGKNLVPKIGDLLILFSAALIGISTILLRVVTKKNSATETITYWRIIAGAFPVILTSFIINRSIIAMQYLHLLIVLSFLQIFILVFWARTLSVSSTSYATMMSMITPIVVAIFAIPLFGEIMNSQQIMGGLLIVYGGVMTQIKGFANHD